MQNADGVRRLSEPELLRLIHGGLQALRGMCAAYDSGIAAMAFSMSTEVHRILTSNSVAVRLRGTRRFPTIETSAGPTNLMSEFKLVVAQVGGDPPALTFLPNAEGVGGRQIRLKFRDWWNRDVIYRASAAKPDAPPRSIPMMTQDQVPYDRRATLVRRQLVETLRNKLGAHLDEDIPEVLDSLQKDDPFCIVFDHHTSQGKLSTADGTLPLKVGPLAAMMRRISGEVLDAYEEWSPELIS